MKRIAKKPTLLQKSRVKTVARRADTPHRVDATDFSSEILRHGGRAKVCVIRSVGGLGDVLMCTPALRELKRRWPATKLTFAIDRHRTQSDVYHQLVRNAPFIDEIVDARFVKQREFDSVVDISSVCIRYENLGLPPINRIDLFARRMGIQRLRDPLPFYKVEQDEVLWARKYISDRKSNNKVVVLHTASFEDKRCWPIYKYLQLVDYSKAQGDAIKFLVLDFNHKYANWDKHSNVFECSHTTVREMAALISESDLFIGPDSGPMHLAGALKKKSLVMFGSIPPEARINHYSSHKAIMHPSIGCLGCWYKVCPYQNRCMEDLDMTLVYNEMISKLTA